MINYCLYIIAGIQPPPVVAPSNSTTDYLSLVVGVVSGVFSSIMFEMLKSFVIQVVIPWYQIRVYKGFDVSGHWEGEQIRGDIRYTFTIDIKQSGHNLTGKYTAVDYYQETTKTKHFSLSGSIYNNNILINYESMYRQTFGVGTFLLAVHDGGNELRGAVTFLKTSAGRIGTDGDLILRRKI